MENTQNLPALLVVIPGNQIRTSGRPMGRITSNVLVLDDAARQKAMAKRNRIRRYGTSHPPTAA